MTPPTGAVCFLTVEFWVSPQTGARIKEPKQQGLMAGANLTNLLPAITKNICKLRYPGEHAAEHLRFEAAPRAQDKRNFSQL